MKEPPSNPGALDDAEPQSKTARKREAERLQQLGKRISELPTEQRQGLSLPDNLRHAVEEYLRFPSREAKRRQLQFVGKLMRGLDLAQIEAELDAIAGESATAQYAFHQLERWRDRLLADPNALSEYIDAHPEVDRQALRHTLQRARNSKTDAQRKQYARELFRFLRAQHPDTQD